MNEGLYARLWKTPSAHISENNQNVRHTSFVGAPSVVGCFRAFVSTIEIRSLT